MKRRHGMAKTKVYAVWYNMLRRCQTPELPAYKNYGGRGIRVCTRWQTFENFYADMGEPPPGECIERIDNDGNYEPQNCTWASRTVQSRNRRGRTTITVDGVTATLSEWSAKTGIPLKTLSFRLKNGWTSTEAVRTPLIKKGMRGGIPRGELIRERHEMSR